MLIKSVFNLNENHYYYNTFLGKGLCDDKSYTQLFKWIFAYYIFYISIELTFLEEFILLKQVHQKSPIFVTIGIFSMKDLSFVQMSAIDLMIY